MVNVIKYSVLFIMHATSIQFTATRLNAHERKVFLLI